MDTMEGRERLATVEAKVHNIEEALRDIKSTLEELKPIVWKAAGGATLALICVEVLLKIPGGH